MTATAHVTITRANPDEIRVYTVSPEKVQGTIGTIGVQIGGHHLFLTEAAASRLAEQLAEHLPVPFAVNGLGVTDDAPVGEVGADSLTHAGEVFDIPGRADR